MKMSAASMLVFTDFDGCLHPENCARDMRFCRMRNLARLMERHPEVGVVVTSSWRRHRDIDALRAFFPPEVRHQVQGGTPDLFSADDRAPYLRYREVLAYLQGSGKSGQPWIAIEDGVDMYPTGLSNIVQLDPAVGFDEHGEEQLERLLKRLSGNGRESSAQKEQD